MEIIILSSFLRCLAESLQFGVKITVVILVVCVAVFPQLNWEALNKRVPVLIPQLSAVFVTEFSRVLLSIASHFVVSRKKRRDLNANSEEKCNVEEWFAKSS